MTEDANWLEGEAADTVPLVSLTKRELSLATGYTLTRIDKLVRHGMPARPGASRREGLRFDLPAVIEWIAQHRADQRGGEGETTEAIKRRLASAQARRVELENAANEREILPVDEVVSFIGEKFGAIRAAALSLPTQVPGLTGDQRAALEDAVYNMLAEVSGMKRQDWGADEESDSE